MAQWNLTTKIGSYLDRHLVFPLLEFLANNKIFDRKELLQVRHDIAMRTMMIDYAIEVYKELHTIDLEPPELTERKKDVMVIVTKCHTETQYIRHSFEEASEDTDLMDQITATRDGRVLLEYMVKNYNFEVYWMDEIYSFAKFQYECGNYTGCTQYLYLCKMLLPSTEKIHMNVLWGKLACEILLQNWDSTIDDFTHLKEFVDSNNFGSALIALQQRAWLIHWSLFVFFNNSKGQDMLIEMFLFQQQYLNAIQTTCPHILRYLTAAVIINKQRPSVMKELVKVIQQESYHYRDPITEFVECLYVNFDFDGAQKKLRECEQVLKQDFFLVSCLDAFIESARMVIFETFCCIHQCISITMLADKLNMTPEAAEKWIVNLIRNARLDAKIDSRLGHVVMSINTLSPYQQIIEKTKGLSFRGQLLTSNLEKKVASNLPERVPYWAAPEF